MSELVVLVSRQLREIVVVTRVLLKLEGQDESFELRAHQELQVIALKLLESSHEPGHPELFEHELLGAPGVLDAFILGVLGDFRVQVHKVLLVVE